MHNERGWDMHSEENNSLKYFWQWNACLRVDHPVPQKTQEGSGGANLRARCGMAWVPASLDLYRLSGNICFELPAAIALSQLPSGAGAPTSVTHHQPSSQRAPWGPSTDSGNPTVTLVSHNASGQTMSSKRVLLWDKRSGGGRRKKKKKRDRWWWFRRTQK